jgi:hypothetical protein
MTEDRNQTTDFRPQFSVFRPFAFRSSLPHSALRVLSLLTLALVKCVE